MIEEKLEGDSLKVRHRNFNNLVNKVTSEEFSDEYIKSLLSSNSRLDQIFLSELANRFRNSFILCELFKSEDSIIVSKALKCKWFFEGIENTNIVNADYFLHNLFPYLCHITRHKVINNLGIYLKNETEAENFYLMISERYGRISAVKLLPACSKEFFFEKISNINFTIPKQQLKFIYKKYPEPVIIYIKKLVLRGNYKIGQFKNIIESIALHHPEHFIDLVKIGYNISLDFGYETTVKLLETDEEYVIKNSPKFYQHLNVGALLKKLKGAKRDEFIINLLPRDSKDFAYNCIERIFKHFRSEYGSNYLVRLYKMMYFNERITQNKNISHSFIIHLPSNLRIAWANNMLSQKENTQEKYLKYMSTDYAIEKFEEKIKQSLETNDRIALLHQMVDCCKINNDTDALLKVLIYTEIRHKHDHDNLRYMFLKHLQSSFLLYELSADHWKLIYQMTKILIENGDAKKYDRDYFLSTLLENYIHYKILHSEDFSQILNILLKLTPNRLNLLKDYPEYEKLVLDMIFEIYKPSIVNQPINRYIGIKIKSLFNAYTMKNKKTKISKLVKDHVWLIDSIHLWFDTPEAHDTCFNYLLFLITEISETKIMFADKIFKLQFGPKIFKNALIHNTKNIYENFNFVMNHISQYDSISQYYKEYCLISTYMKTPLCNSIENYLRKNMIKNKWDFSKFTESINCLLLLLNVVETEKVLTKYIPFIKKITTSIVSKPNTEFIEAWNLIKHFKLINPPPKYEILSLFLKRYLFKYRTFPISKICLKKSEVSTIDFIKKLDKKNVSIKKQSIHLVHLLFPKSDRLSIYKILWEKEKSRIIRCMIFMKTKTLFQEETDILVAKDAIQAVKEMIKSLNEKEQYLFSHLHDLSKIEEKFISEFLKMSWNVLKTLENSKILVQNCQYCLIYDAIKQLKYLNEESREILIDEYFTYLMSNAAVKFYDPECKNLVNALSNFCIKNLIYSKSFEIQKENLEKFSIQISLYILKNWDIIQCRKSINLFLHSLCQEVLKCEFILNPSILISNLFDCIKLIVPFQGNIITNLELLLTKAFAESVIMPIIFSSDLSTKVLNFLQSFTVKIIQIYENFINTYGSEVIKLFFTALHRILNSSVTNDFFSMLLVLKLLEIKKSKHIMYLAIDILPNQISDQCFTDLQLLQKLIQQIGEYNDPTVKMMLGNKFHMPLFFFSAF